MKTSLFKGMAAYRKRVNPKFSSMPFSHNHLETYDVHPCFLKFVRYFVYFSPL